MTGLVKRIILPVTLSLFKAPNLHKIVVENMYILGLMIELFKG